MRGDDERLEHHLRINHYANLVKLNAPDYNSHFSDHHEVTCCKTDNRKSPIEVIDEYKRQRRASIVSESEVHAFAFCVWSWFDEINNLRSSVLNFIYSTGCYFKKCFPQKASENHAKTRQARIRTHAHVSYRWI